MSNSELNLTNDTFLNPEFFYKLKSDITKLINNIKISKNKMRLVAKDFKYIRTFKTKGVQGIAGILELKNNKNAPQIVFKVSVEVDRAIEHEYLVSDTLCELRTFCPHFMGCYSMITLPISNSFISQEDDEDEIDLFKSDVDNLPTSLAFLEYVSNISLYHVCKYGDRNQILAQLLMILMALQISQIQHNFTHYDLHMDNILIRQCEEDSFFIYILDNELYCVPTYGHFPVMIDMGSSFIDTLEGKPMYTGIDNYDNGLQPTLFDSINDIHHLLLSVLYYLEDDSKEFDVVSGRVMHYFKNIPILRKKGWKQLPVDLVENIFEYIYALDPTLEKNKLIKDYEMDLINVLCYSVRLPWKPIDDMINEDIDKEFITNFSYIVKEFEKFNKIDLVHDFDTLYILRELITIIDNYRDTYKQDYKQIEKDFRSNVAFLVNKKNFPVIDFPKLIESIVVISKHLSSFFYYNVNENVEVINDCYLKTTINSPIKMYKKLKQNVALRNKFNGNSILYFMDVDNKNSRRIRFGDVFTPNEMMMMNEMTSKQQEKCLLTRYKRL